MKYNIGNRVLIKKDIKSSNLPKRVGGKVLKITNVVQYNLADYGYTVKGLKGYVKDEDIEKLVEGCKKPLNKGMTNEDIMLINFAEMFGLHYIVPTATGKGIMFIKKPIQVRDIHGNAPINYWVSANYGEEHYFVPKYLSFQTNDDTEPFCIDNFLKELDFRKKQHSLKKQINSLFKTKER